MSNDVYSRDELRSLGIMTEEYRYNLNPGRYLATLDIKAEGHQGTLRLFFTFANGAKVIAPVYWWQRYLGFYEIPCGSKLMLTYEECPRGTFLTGAEQL